MKHFTNFFSFSVSTLLIVSYILIKPGLSNGFSYDTNDTQNGPSNWSGSCQTGFSQSPINIVDNSTSSLSYGTFYPNEEYLRGMTNASIQNTGHTIQLIPSSSNMSLRMQLPNENATLIFWQIHFHWSSEHYIDSKQYDLECHFIHFQSEFDNITHAANSGKSNALVIMGLLFEVSENNSSGPDNMLLKPLTDNLALALESTPNSVEVPLDFNPWNLITAGKSSFEAYTYTGSLTTPDCTEKMKWLVLKDPQHLSVNQWNTFRSIKDGEGNSMEGNCRPLQNLNGRQVDKVRIKT